MISVALISIPISQNDKLMKWEGIESFLDSGEIFDKNFQNFQFIEMTGRDQLTRAITKADLRMSVDL